MLKQKSEYSRYYGDFRGVDFSSDHTLVADSRFPYLVNMYKDYAAGGGQGIETIPGFRRRFVAPNGGAVHGIHSYRDKNGKRHVLVHAGEKLYKWDNFPEYTGAARDVIAIAKEYDEYSSDIGGVGIATDCAEVSVQYAQNIGVDVLDVRAIRVLGSQTWISIYPRRVFIGETASATHIPGAYRVIETDIPGGKIARIVFPKVIKDSEGTVIASISPGDAIEVQYAAVSFYMNGPNQYHTYTLESVIDFSNDAHGRRYYRFAYTVRAVSGEDLITQYRFEFSSGRVLTRLHTEDIPEGISEYVSGSERVEDIQGTNKYTRDVIEWSTTGSTSNGYLYVYCYADEEGRYYQELANGERYYIPEESCIPGAKIWVNDLNCTHCITESATALEYDEYAEEGKIDYVSLSTGESLAGLTHVWREGGGEIDLDECIAADKFLLVPKSLLSAGDRTVMRFGDSLSTIVRDGMNERGSASFVFGDKLYIIDGKSYLVYDGDTVSRVVDNAYVPTTYINIIVGGENADAGEELEPRNMLSPYFKHTFIPDGKTTEYYMNEKDLDGIKEVVVYGKVMKEGEDADYTVDLTNGKVIFSTPPELVKAGFKVVAGTPGLKYTLTDAGTYVCSGLGTAEGTEIVIGNYYNGARVKEVGNAFNNKGLTSVRISEGVISAGDYSFGNNIRLVAVELPESLENIGYAAFIGAGVESITIPKRVYTIGAFAFRESKNLQTVVFEGKPRNIGYHAFKDCENLKSVTVAWSEGAFPDVEAYWKELGATITYNGESADEEDEVYYPEEYAGVEITGVKGAYPVIEGDGETTGEEFRSMIESATIATVFDNRVFFSGVPSKPNFVFWSSLKNPSYIGILNYQQDGVGTTPITAMVPVAKTLLVLKGDTEDGGAAFYHTPAESGIDVMSKAYPSEGGLAGIGCLGAACNFLDDPVYVSRLGLEGIEYLSLQNERSRGHRSSLVDAKLVNTQNLASAKMCEWAGYLVLLVDGKIFLADSRQRYTDAMGSAQYEWYYLEDIGVYRGQHKKYSYLKEYPEVLLGEDGAPRAFKVAYNGKEYPVKLIGDILPDSDIDTVGEGIDTVITQVEIAEGFKVEIVAAMYEQNGEYHACLCDTNDEMVGGEFCPAVVIKTIDEGGENLYFGTTNGVVCSFNFDKRGADGAIPPDYYTFDGRAIYSGCALKMDNCGIPHMTKTTVKKSTVIKAKSFMRTAAKVRVRTNSNPYNEIARINGTRFSFEDMDFSDFSFVVGEDTLFAIREKEKKWVEKQYFIYSDEYKKPFALYYLAYKYFIAGKYKG